jgi:hypothetical protein
MAIKVNEKVRRIVSNQGHEIRLHNVKTVDNSGSWLRFESDEGYVLANPQNIVAMVIRGEKTF